MATTTKKDYSAIKFQVAEALGEWMNILYLKGYHGESEESYHPTFIHHQKADGISAIKMIARDEDLPIKSLPGLKSNSKPLFTLIALFRYLKLTKKVKQFWIYKRKDITGIPQHFCLARIEGETLHQLNEKARSLGVSTNALMLTALDQATQKLLLTQDSARKWILPLNMRAKEQAHLIDGNYSASIILNFKGSRHYTSKETHDAIKSYLKKNLHWGSFLYSNMARFIGFKGTLRVARSIKEVGTGVFSNLGKWPGEFLDVGEENNIRWRAVVAPSTQILPVAAASWQWKETMGLTLQLHPSLNLPHERMTYELLSEWLKLMGCQEAYTQIFPWADFPNAPKRD